MRKLLWVLVLLVSKLSISTTFAVAETGWEFSGAQAPSFSDLAVNEKDYWMLECPEKLDVLYWSYGEKHSGFAKYFDQPEMREKWLLASVREYFKEGAEALSICAYEYIVHDFRAFADEESYRTTPVFCGVPGLDLNKAERKYVRRLETLTHIAVSGGFRAAYNLLSATDVVRGYHLSPDIRFFIVEAMKREAPSVMANFRGKKNSFEIPDHKTGLSKERMAEIRDAVTRNDPSVVINEWTTCIKFKL